jgi:hypothetical protein
LPNLEQKLRELIKQDQNLDQIPKSEEEKDEQGRERVQQSLTLIYHLIESLMKGKKITLPGITPIPWENSVLFNNKIESPGKDKPENEAISTAKRASNSKYKTLPCRWFHSPLGCERGENCDYIHDYNYMGTMPPPHTYKSKKLPLSGQKPQLPISSQVSAQSPTSQTQQKRPQVQPQQAVPQTVPHMSVQRQPVQQPSMQTQGQIRKDERRDYRGRVYDDYRKSYRDDEMAAVPVGGSALHQNQRYDSSRDDMQNKRRDQRKYFDENQANYNVKAPRERPQAQNGSEETAEDANAENQSEAMQSEEFDSTGRPNQAQAGQQPKERSEKATNEEDSGQGSAKGTIEKEERKQSDIEEGQVSAPSTNKYYNDYNRNFKGYYGNGGRNFRRDYNRNYSDPYYSEDYPEGEYDNQGYYYNERDRGYYNNNDYYYGNRNRYSRHHNNYYNGWSGRGRGGWRTSNYRNYDDYDDNYYDEEDENQENYDDDTQEGQMKEDTQEEGDQKEENGTQNYNEQTPQGQQGQAGQKDSNNSNQQTSQSQPQAEQAATEEDATQNQASEQKGEEEENQPSPPKEKNRRRGDRDNHQQRDWNKFNSSYGPFWPKGRNYRGQNYNYNQGFFPPGDNLSMQMMYQLPFIGFNNSFDFNTIMQFASNFQQHYQQGNGQPQVSTTAPTQIATTAVASGETQQQVVPAQETVAAQSTPAQTDPQPSPPVAAQPSQQHPQPSENSRRKRHQRDRYYQRENSEETEGQQKDNRNNPSGNGNNLSEEDYDEEDDEGAYDGEEEQKDEDRNDNSYQEEQNDEDLYDDQQYPAYSDYRYSRNRDYDQRSANYHQQQRMKFFNQQFFETLKKYPPDVFKYPFGNFFPMNQGQQNNPGQHGTQNQNSFNMAANLPLMSYMMSQMFNPPMNTSGNQNSSMQQAQPSAINNIGQDSSNMSGGGAFNLEVPSNSLQNDSRATLQQTAQQPVQTVQTPAPQPIIEEPLPHQSSHHQPQSATNHFIDINSMLNEDNHVKSVVQEKASSNNNSAQRRQNYNSFDDNEDNAPMEHGRTIHHGQATREQTEVRSSPNKPSVPQESRQGQHYIEKEDYVYSTPHKEEYKQPMMLEEFPNPNKSEPHNHNSAERPSKAQEVQLQPTPQDSVEPKSSPPKVTPAEPVQQLRRSARRAKKDK